MKYEKPTLIELGSIAELTEQGPVKQFGESDGLVLVNQPIKDLS